MSGNDHDSHAQQKFIGSINVEEVFTRGSDFNYAPFLTYVKTSSIDFNVQKFGSVIKASGNFNVNTNLTTGTWASIATFSNASGTVSGQRVLVPKQVLLSTAATIAYGQALIAHGAANTADLLTPAVVANELTVTGSNTLGIKPVPCRLYFDGTNTFSLQVFVPADAAVVAGALTTTSQVLITHIQWDGMNDRIPDTL